MIPEVRSTHAREALKGAHLHREKANVKAKINHSCQYSRLNVLRTSKSDVAFAQCKCSLIDDATKLTNATSDHDYEERYELKYAGVNFLLLSLN